MSAELTERQQQIASLVKQGLKPPQIAKKLKVSDNAVYQQLRIMREKGGMKPAAKKAPAKKKPAAKAATPVAPKVAKVVEVKNLTPLQAVRLRRSEIEAKVKASAAEVEAAQKAHAKLAESHDALVAKHNAELAQLSTAEGALTGATPKAAAAKPATKPAGAKPASPPRKAPVKPAAAKPAAQAAQDPTEAPGGAQAAPEAPQAGDSPPNQVEVTSSTGAAQATGSSGTTGGLTSIEGGKA